MALVQFFLELTAALADTVALNSTTAAVSLFVMAVASMAVSYGGRLVAIDCKSRSAAECLQSEYVAKDARKVSGNRTKDEYDMIIVGGGCAGAALAGYVAKGLAKNKKTKRILVVERDMSEPDRIVGELLQPAGVSLLKDMGLEETLEGYDGQTIVGYAVTYKGQHFTINYPNLNGKVQEGIAFHNGKFVMALRECAKKQPGVTFVEATVTKLVEDSGRITGVVYRTADGQTTEVHAALTVACDGVGSFLRNVLSSPDIYHKSHFLGLVLRGKPPYNNRGTVILCDPSPTLVYPISSDEVRMLIDFPDRLPSSTDGSLQKDLRERLCPQLPPSIQQSFLNAVKEGNFKAMPNRILPARPHLIPGCAMLGDSLNMRHPLTGGGMTVAFTDAKALGQRLINLGDFSNEPAVTKAVGEFYETRNPPNAAINILSEALHQVFAAKNDDLRDACYKYLSVGGFRAEGPISVLSGLNRNQLFLIYHFFAVAIYGVQYCVGYFPTPFRLWRAFKMIRTAVGIIHPLLLKENNDLAARVYTNLMRVAFFI